jgi:hypothetical protein
MRIHSVVPNTAATERLFSKFGIVHNKLRNRLSPEKVRKSVLVSMDTIEKYGSARRAQKRKFGVMSASASSANVSGLVAQTSASVTGSNPFSAEAGPTTSATTTSQAAGSSLSTTTNSCLSSLGTRANGSGTHRPRIDPFVAGLEHLPSSEVGPNEDDNDDSDCDAAERTFSSVSATLIQDYEATEAMDAADPAPDRPLEALETLPLLSMKEALRLENLFVYSVDSNDKSASHLTTYWEGQAQEGLAKEAEHQEATYQLRRQQGDK